MFSKVLVKLTAIVLFSNCISATPATLPGQPGEAKSLSIAGNVDIHARVFKQYQCQDPFRWVRRECNPIWGARAWRDVCVQNTFETLYDYKPGSCPKNTFCFNGFNDDGFRFIYCMTETTEKEPVSGQKRKSDPQAGTSGVKRGRSEIGNTQQQFSVSIDHDMSGAAVDAFFESRCLTFNVHRRMFFAQMACRESTNLGTDGSFIIAPNNVIVGNVHGYKENVCHGNKNDQSTARDCYPNGTYDFKAGQTIDFTWGMTGDQEGILVYGIVPAQSVTG